MNTEPRALILSLTDCSHYLAAWGLNKTILYPRPMSLSGGTGPNRLLVGWGNPNNFAVRGVG